jgi:hypothetical protein
MPEDDADGRKMSASFILGVALLLKRPVAVVQCCKGEKVYDTVRVYGARSDDDRLVLTRATPDAQSTVDTYVNTTIAVLVESVCKNPMAHAVILYNGTDHFNPWVHTMRVSSGGVKQQRQRSLFDMAEAVEEEKEKELEAEGEGEGEGEGEEEAEAEAAPEAEAGMAMSNPLTISITHLYHNPYPTSTSPPQLLLQP